MVHHWTHTSVVRGLNLADDNMWDSLKVYSDLTLVVERDIKSELRLSNSSEVI